MKLSRTSFLGGLVVAALLAFAAPVFAGTVSWSGRLAAPDPTWNRVGDGCAAATTNVEWYDTQPFSVSVTGSYTIDMTAMTGTISPDGYFALYTDSFAAGNPQTNCVSTDDDTGPGLAPSFVVSLQAGRQYFLVTTQCCDGVAAGEEVDYTNQISGPGTILLGLGDFSVPTLSPAGMLGTVMLMAGFAAFAIRRRRSSRP